MAEPRPEDESQGAACRSEPNGHEHADCNHGAVVQGTVAAEDCADCGDDDASQDALSDADSGRALAGGLILRGNRCVLVRSLTGEWEGMRIPWVASERGEASASAAVRAVVELCDIEADEVRVLRDLAPVNIVVPDMAPIAVWALYAKSAPPGPLEAADVEDPEDLYDWYTFPRAMHALAADPYARAALVTMACSLVAGRVAGIVPNQWGGVFGQEWTDQALRLVPGGALTFDGAGGGGSSGSGGDLATDSASRKRARTTEESPDGHGGERASASSTASAELPAAPEGQVSQKQAE